MHRAMAVLLCGAALALAACSPVNAHRGWPGYGDGPGPGMMGGPGPMMGDGYGWGPMMGGGGRAGLPRDLTMEQYDKIAAIQRELRAKQWPLMRQMHELMWTDAQDEQAQRRDYDQLAALQRQMFENMLDARKRIDAVLTPQQREELRREGGPRARP